MNTKLVTAAVAIILVGVGAYMLWGKGSGGYGPTTTVPVGGGSTSLQELVAAGKPVTCTFATTTPSGNESGTIYIANGMMAGEFAVGNTRSGDISAHMIIKNQTSYTWTSISNQGFKSTVSTTESTQQGVTYTAQINYSCQAWKPNSSKFDVPANISFNP